MFELLLFNVTQVESRTVLKVRKLMTKEII